MPGGGRSTGPSEEGRVFPGARASLRLLSGFELSGSEGPIEISLCEQRVLALLALNPRPQSRAFVAGTLWWSSDEARAHASLRSVVWRLRRCSAAPVNGNKADLWLGSHVDVDVHRQARYAQRRLSDPQCDPLSDEVEVLEGDLLPSWYEDWILFERETLRQQRLHALEHLASALLERGRYGEAIRVATSAIRSDPLRESPHRLLIRIDLAEGNVTEARRHASCYRAYLARHGQTEPSEMFAALAERASAHIS
jgi:DNA-binding SARP family transcriptional activator